MMFIQSLCRRLRTALFLYSAFTNVAHAGKEIITVTCGTQVLYDTSTTAYVVPVTITLTNGSPDTIDMVYTTITNNGTPTTQINSFYLTKNQSVTDNIYVSGATGDNINFQATGTGEAFDADNDTANLNFAIGSAPAPNAPAPLTVTYGTWSKVDQTPVSVPIKITLTTTGANDAAQPQVTYTNNGASVVKTYNLTAPDPTKSVSDIITLSIPSGTTAPNLTIGLSGVTHDFSFPIDEQDFTQANLAFHLGPSLRRPACNLRKISIGIPAGITKSVKLYATDSNGNFYACFPKRIPKTDAGKTVTVTVDVTGATQPVKLHAKIHEKNEAKPLQASPAVAAP